MREQGSHDPWAETVLGALTSRKGRVVLEGPGLEAVLAEFSRLLRSSDSALRASALLLAIADNLERAPNGRDAAVTLRGLVAAAEPRLTQLTARLPKKPGGRFAN
jgi:hypothetical protein